MKSLIFASLFVLSLANAFSSIQAPWRDYSSPSIMSPSFQRNFSSLPLQGSQGDSQKLWASDYWPTNRGGINFRWNAPKQIGFDLVSPTRSQVLSFSSEHIAMLSASEKFDILNGQYTYPLRREVESNSSRSAPSWNGICNGWAPASINHNEPLPKTLINPDGVKVPFGSSDIKALLSYYYAFKHQVQSTYQMGRRCNYNFGPYCSEDLNAGAFHIVLANKVGIEQSSFVADVERFRQVWNHAVNAYKTTVINASLAPSSDSAHGTVRRIHVKTDMSFVLKIKNNSWYPVLGTDDHVDDVRNYEYFLDVDSSGNIIGGEWISNARPDFLWTMEKAQSFSGYFTRLSELLND